MAKKRSATAARKRVKPAARWGVYLVSGLVLAVLCATVVAG